MGMGAILFNGSEPSEQIGNTLSTKRPMWNIVKIALAVSKKMTFVLFVCVEVLRPSQPNGAINLLYILRKGLLNIFPIQMHGDANLILP